MAVEEGIKYIIAADDQASDSFRDVQASAQDAAVEIETFNKRTKSTIVVARGLSSAFGGTEFGNAANDIAMLVDKVEKLSSVAGLAAKSVAAIAVAVIGYKIGSVIGEWVFQTEKLNEQFEEMLKTTQEIGKQSAQKFAGSFAEEAKIIEIKFTDPEERREQIRQLRGQLGKEISAIEVDVKRREAVLNSLLKLRWYSSTDGPGIPAEFQGMSNADVRATAKRLESELAVQEEKLSLLKKQRSEFDYQLESAYSIALQEKEQNEKVAQEERERIKLNEMALMQRQQSEFAYWQEQADAFAEQQKQEQQVADQRRKNYEERMAAERKLRQEQIKTVNDSYMNTLRGMQQELTVLTQGQAVANAMKFEAQGFTKETAAELGKLQAEFEDLRGRGSAGPTTNAAFESRTLSGRASGTNPQAEQVNQLKQLNAIQAKVERLIANQQATLEQVARNTQIMFDVLGR